MTRRGREITDMRDDNDDDWDVDWEPRPRVTHGVAAHLEVIAAGVCPVCGNIDCGPNYGGKGYRCEARS